MLRKCYHLRLAFKLDGKNYNNSRKNLKYSNIIEYLFKLS